MTMLIKDSDLERLQHVKKLASGLGELPNELRQEIYRHVSQVLENMRMLQQEPIVQPAKIVATRVCCGQSKSIDGWWCTRSLGHNGPCALARAKQINLE
jgi:hypothetical protein